MTATQENGIQRGPSTLPDVILRTPLRRLLFEDKETILDHARAIEHRARSGEPLAEDEELVLLEDVWPEYTRSVQIELNEQAGKDHEAKPVHTRQIQTSKGDIDIEYEDCSRLASITAKDGTVYQWYFRRVALPEGTNVLRIPKMSDFAFSRNQPDQLVLRRQFPQPQPSATPS